MKLLFLTPYLPSPPRTGGERRLHALMSGLARSHEVSVLSQVRAGTEYAEAVETTGQYCREVVTVPNAALDAGGNHKRRLQRRSLLSTKSFEHWAYAAGEYQRALDRMLERTSYDAITAEFATMSYFRLPAGPVRVLDEHNIEYDIHYRTARTDNQIQRRLYSAVNFLKLRREERDAWRRFDGCVLTSERDRQVLLRDVPQARTCVVPNGVDTGFFLPNPAPPRRDTILFFGAIDYYPNTQGLLFFLHEIWPTLLAHNSSLKLTIVGQSPPASILAHRSDNVVVTGFVDDIRPYVANASVVVVPLQIGGGTRLKILEAMAMGKAIVSTSIGAEGIDVVHERNVMIADTARDFTARVEQVLADPGLRDALGREARALMTSTYEWHVGVRGLENFYREIQAARAGLRPSVALA